MIHRRYSIVGGVVISALGAWFHNSLEFPSMAFTAPEMLSVLVPTLALSTWWLIRPGRAVWWATLAWIGINLMVGAALSVLPLPIWPFDPAQTLPHYLNHLAYGFTQVPALHALWLSRSEVASI